MMPSCCQQADISWAYQGTNDMDRESESMTAEALEREFNRVTEELLEADKERAGTQEGTPEWTRIVERIERLRIELMTLATWSKERARSST